MTIIENEPQTASALTASSADIDEQITGIRSGLTYQLSDRDPEETQEWIDSFDQLVEAQGTERAQF
ncbi:hypothetical protein, partial [Glutamicibacter sp. PS]